MNYLYPDSVERFYKIAEPDETILGPARPFLDYWNEVRGDAFAPAWGRQFKMTGLDIKDIPNVSVVDVLPPDNPGMFTYRYWGTNHTALKGYEMSGKTLLDSPTKLIRDIGIAQFSSLIERRRPTVFIYSVNYPTRAQEAEMILRVPLSNDGERVTGIASYQELSKDPLTWLDLFNPEWEELSIPENDAD